MKNFKFGDNWQKYLKFINSETINQAKQSLLQLYKIDSFKNKSFIDIGSGSGLFSLAACFLGAKVVSIDIDINSIRCALFLKKKYKIPDEYWKLEKASILDLNSSNYFKNNHYDLIYSWGVLHHTGNMNLAIKNLLTLANSKSLIIISLYNHRPVISKIWYYVKYFYNFNYLLRIVTHLILLPYLSLYIFKNLIIDLSFTKRRGMNIFIDYIDWIGGFPFETISPKNFQNLIENYNFELIGSYLVGNKNGCNEYLITKKE